MAGRKKKTAENAAAPEKPQEYVRHLSRPAWGVGVLVSESTAGETGPTKTYLFADGVKRSFKADLIATLVEPAEPPKDEDRERLSRGLLTGGIATPKAINLELEAQIRDRPEDPAPYLVYADWLQQREDPRGQLIPIQADLLRDPNSRKLRDAERKLLEEHGAYLLPESLYAMLRLPHRKPDDPRTRCEAVWKLGFLEHVHLAKRPRQDGDLSTVIEPLLRHPSAHFLRKLTIGSLGTTDEYNYITCIAAIARAKHALLREIVIGDFDPTMMELAFSRTGSVSALFSASKMPSLERLTIRAGNVRFDSNLKHPKVRELHLIVDEMANANLQRVWNAAMPELESLELSCPGMPVDAGSIIRLLRNHPKLKKLALRQTVGTTALLEALLLSESAMEQLTHLELDQGDMADREVPRIEKPAKKRLAHLERLVLSGPRLSANAAKRLSKLGAAVSATSEAKRIPITDSQVVARAPDAKSVPAARSIAKPQKWMRVAREGNRLWGEIEGSDHYYVLANLENAQETSCTCASPKDPCKHALALLFLASAQHIFEEERVPAELVRQTRERPRYRSFSYWDHYE